MIRGAWRHAYVATSAFALLFLSAVAAILVTRGSANLSPVWPVNAIFLVLLLRAPAHAWMRRDIIVGAAAASVLANCLGGTPLALSLWLTLANGVEAAVAFTLIRRGAADPSGPASMPRALRLLLLASLAAPAFGALAASAGLYLIAHADFVTSWTSWYLSAAVGMLIVAPLGVSVTREDWLGLFSRAGARSALVCLLLVGAVSTFVFFQDRWPLLFLVTPAVLRAAYERRALGAAAAVTLIAFIAVPLTQMGHGPLSMSYFSSVGERQFILQIFLLSQSMIGLSLAATFDERDALRRALEARERAAREDASAKARLLTGVAHEIRTPLNAISGLGELLEQSEVLPERERVLVDAMVSASQQLNMLANDLLDRARIESGALAMAPQACDPAVLIDEVISEARLLPEAENVTLGATAQKNLALWVDPGRTKQILRNLVSNAIKYAGSHGAITVHAYATPGGMTRLEVRDHGPGISPALQREVFEPFARLAANDRGIKSGGVGLSLVRLLAQAQGGAVGFASTPYVETRFWADLPASPVGGVIQPGVAFGDIDPDVIFGGGEPIRS
jgi:signal transduction histidine kinase